MLGNWRGELVTLKRVRSEWKGKGGGEKGERKEREGRKSREREGSIHVIHVTIFTSLIQSL